MILIETSGKNSLELIEQSIKYGTESNSRSRFGNTKKDPLLMLAKATVVTLQD